MFVVIEPKQNRCKLQRSGMAGCSSAHVAPLELRTAAHVVANHKIRAREVRVIGIDGKQLGVMPVAEPFKQLGLRMLI